MSYQVLARKWRPRNFAQVVGQQHVLKPLFNALKTGRLHHAWLLTGTRGVGKTTIARILAKSLNCEQGITAEPCGTCSACVAIEQGRFVDLLEIDAASRTKVEDTRELLDNVQYAPTQGRFKVYLIDEVHMLSRHSFNALLKTLEEPPEHVKFLLATTDPQKLPITVLSRCLQFNLKALSRDEIANHLQQVLSAEQIPFDADAIQALARAAQGSLRDALSLTDQAIAQGEQAVTVAGVQQMLGSVPGYEVAQLLQQIVAGDAAGMMQTLDNVASQVPDLAGLLPELQQTVQQMALFQVVPHSAWVIQLDEQAQQLAGQLAAELLQVFYDILVQGRRDLALAADVRSGVEMTLLRLLAFRPQSLEVNEIPAVAGSSTAVKKPQAASATESVQADAVYQQTLHGAADTEHQVAESAAPPDSKPVAAEHQSEQTHAAPVTSVQAADDDEIPAYLGDDDDDDDDRFADFAVTPGATHAASTAPVAAPSVAADAATGQRAAGLAAPAPSASSKPDLAALMATRAALVEKQQSSKQPTSASAAAPELVAPTELASAAVEVPATAPAEQAQAAVEVPAPAEQARAAVEVPAPAEQARVVAPVATPAEPAAPVESARSVAEAAGAPAPAPEPAATTEPATPAAPAQPANAGLATPAVSTLQLDQLELAPQIRLAAEIDGWAAMIDHLELHGLTRQLARNGNLQKTAQGHVLVCQKNWAYLLNDAAIDTIKQGMLAQFDIQLLDVVIGDTQQATPAEIQQYIDAQRLARAKQTLQQDPVAQQLAQVFGAELQEDSVQPE
ncbi:MULTISPECIES: DNA polymerase III subunit gamma/tau [Pseudidiomarina]|uniref:DNA polymerase III subunit gamma/tau n=2 Tax=Pseudidiomarina TaxID=2800384 RepID=A0A368V6S7_9GAMM|nr:MULTISPECIES: DNA polymerase III subunit gamma/tau [Pseudidiomarina]PWW15965.1 DNA polymerase III gamma subunit /DNA polymerase III tau subunit [Pseudidiomarina maritima]RBP93525.1 DNA polymerase III gamma subunit /DNA polymerase III tau subunit [Pseudidiomarina tainanensis]RCW35985.1 DNA polymerase III gamma subunit /DNA polymerase III tau subunit [Pseudidiomarina tainanensis]